MKYTWDPELAAFEASKVLPLGLTFPFDFGFIPGTEAADGAPLDALVIADAPLAMGCVVECRVLGAFEIETSEEPGGKPIRNDRVIVVPTESIRGADWQQLSDLGPVLTRQIGEFLESYVERERRTYRLLDQVGRDPALELVKRAC